MGEENLERKGKPSFSFQEIIKHSAAEGNAGLGEWLQNQKAK